MLRFPRARSVAQAGQRAQQIGAGDRETGLVVLEPPSTGPLAGEVKIYDIIVEVARQPVQTLEDWQKALDEYGDQRLLIRVRRYEHGLVRDLLIVKPESPRRISRRVDASAIRGLTL